jgi:signal peptidase I
MLRGPIIALVAMVGLWALLAPAALGGWMSYVTVEGTSMQPGLTTGDLVVVRRQDTYGPGDVVAYRSGLGGALVLHRIVDTDGDRFVVKGDNNDFTDLDRPTPSDIVGRQVMAVPGAGSTVTAMGQPAAVIGLLAAAAGLVALGMVAGGRRRRQRRSHEHDWSRQQRWSHHEESSNVTGQNVTGHQDLPSPPSPVGPPGNPGTPLPDADDLIGDGRPGQRVVGPPALWLVVTAIAVSLAVVVWMAPATTTETEFRPYVVGLTFDYQTEVPPNPVYGDGIVRTGDTVFSAVLDAVDMRVESDIVSVDVLAGTSQLALSVEVSSTAGWKRELAVNAAPASAGPTSSDSITIDFAQARLVADEVASVTGSRGEVTVLVRAAFTASDVDFADTDSPDMVTGEQPDGISRAAETVGGPMIVVYRFALDESAATPSAPEPIDTQLVDEDFTPSPGLNAATANGDDRPDGSLSRSVVSRRVAVDVTRPAQVNLGFIEVDVSVARWVATALAMIAGCLAVVGLVTYSTARRRGEASWIAVRHRSQLVSVRSLPEGRDGGAIEVGSFDALRAMSAAVDQLIMVDANNHGVNYYVLDGPVTYRYHSDVRPNGESNAADTDSASGGGARRDTDSGGGMDAGRQ